MPKIKNARAIAQFSLGTHRGVLFGDIEPAGRVEYAYLLTVFDPAKEVAFIVSSEVNSMKPVLGGGSHYLCVFDESGHSNLGDSDDWADEELFTARALAVAFERLEKTPPAPPASGKDDQSHG